VTVTLANRRLPGPHGDITIFFERPVSRTIMAVAVILFALPAIKAIRARGKRNAAGGGSSAPGRHE
jgi:TctA family transporter